MNSILAPIFIVSSDRSGSTMLRLMLNESPELCIPKETHFLSQLLDLYSTEEKFDKEKVSEICNLVSSHARWPDMGISLDTWMQAIPEFPTLGQIINSLYQTIAKQAGKIRWGDKTPDYIFEIERLKSLYPDAKFIHIIRDGRDVCSSLLIKKWHGTSPSGIGRYWSSVINAGLIWRKEDWYKEVHYENLVLNPEIELKKICTFLNLEFHSDMLNFYDKAKSHISGWQQQHHQKTLRAPKKSDIHRWKKESNLVRVLAFESYAYESMKAVGQEPYFDGKLTVLLHIFKSLEESIKSLVSGIKRIIHQ
jgi:hypothetical protein